MMIGTEGAAILIGYPGKPLKLKNNLSPYHKASVVQSWQKATIYQVGCSMLAQVLCMLDPKR